jgi:hypothetical protein
MRTVVSRKAHSVGDRSVETLGPELEADKSRGWLHPYLALT